MCSPNFSLVQVEQGAPVPALLGGHFQEHLAAGGVRVPQAFRDVGIDTAVLLLVGDCQGKDLPLGEFIEIAHGPNVAEACVSSSAGRNDANGSQMGG